MVIDTSALIAILLAEADREFFLRALEQPGPRLLSAVNSLEAAIVIEARKGPPGGRELDLLLHRARIDVVPFDGEQSEEARRIWREYGKGNHPAGLSFCDCCALALSRISGQHLLFNGDDFGLAGVPLAVFP
jgi:ribonuclease VapC